MLYSSPNYKYLKLTLLRVSELDLALHYCVFFYKLLHSAF